MPSKHKKRAKREARHHVHKREDLDSHQKKTMIHQRQTHIDAYHKKRQKKYNERHAHMSHEEKEHFHNKTRHKMDHIARHGKDGGHRWDYDDRHKNLTPEQKNEYKKKRKAINAKHKSNGSYDTDDHINHLKQNRKAFYGEHQEFHDGKHEDHGEDKEKEKEKIISKWPRRRQLAYRAAQRSGNWAGYASIWGAGFAGGTGNLVSTSLRAASGDFSGAVQHAHSAIGGGVLSAGQDFRSRAGGSNAKSDGLSMGKNILGGSDGQRQNSPKRDRDQDESEGDVSTDEE